MIDNATRTYPKLPSSKQPHPLPLMQSTKPLIKPIDPNASIPITFSLP